MYMRDGVNLQYFAYFNYDVCVKWHDTVFCEKFVECRSKKKYYSFFE